LIYYRKEKINYTENEGILGNPLKGFVMFVNETSKRPFPLSLEYLRLDLNKILPEENKVDLDYLERELSSAKKRKVQLIIRIVCDIPGKDVIPEWAKKKFKLIPYTYKTGVEYYSLDYNDEKLLNAFDNLIKKLGEKYDGDGRIAFWELGTYGHWGEWHMTYVNKTLRATDETKEKILNMHLKYFKKTMSLVRIPEEINKNKSIGYYHDSFAGVEDDNHMDKLFNRTNTWDKPLKYGFGGEIDPDLKNDIFGLEEYLKRMEIDFYKYHPTFLINNNVYRHYETLIEKYPNFIENRNRFEKMMGYNYYSKKGEIKIEKNKNDKNKIDISLTIENKGVAPFYYDWKINFAIIKSDNNGNITIYDERESQLSIKGILPKNSVIWNYNFENVKDDYIDKNNNYMLGLRIPSPIDTYVKLSNKEQRDDGWFIISEKLY